MQRDGAAAGLPLAGAVLEMERVADLAAASVIMAHVSDAISLARSPAFIDNSNMTRSRAGSGWSR